MKKRKGVKAGEEALLGFGASGRSYSFPGGALLLLLPPPLLRGFARHRVSGVRASPGALITLHLDLDFL